MGREILTDENIRRSCNYHQNENNLRRLDYRYLTKQLSAGDFDKKLKHKLKHSESLYFPTPDNNVVDTIKVFTNSDFIINDDMFIPNLPPTTALSTEDYEMSDEDQDTVIDLT